MGYYGYICKHCGKNIRMNEVAQLFHVRHGKVLGECYGHYDGYGRVDEDDIFDRYTEKAAGSPNCHDEIHKSVFRLEDSKELNGDFVQTKVLPDGRPISFIEMMDERYGTKDYAGVEYDNLIALRDEYDSLQNNENIPPKKPAASGVVAYHAKCYGIAVRKGTVDMTPSESDPNQSMGTPRKKFM